MTKEELYQQILQKQSYLCVGLDSDIEKIPARFKSETDPVLAFNKYIIDQTADFCVGYKINTAFYESNGAAGWETMQKTLAHIPQNIFTIADAKRGDIGNTVHQYAKAFFKTLDFNSITVAPYMGKDSVSPFLEYAQKWVILLALTSNPSSQDFQFLSINQDKKTLFEEVLTRSQEWTNDEAMMYVVGATQASMLQKIRSLAPKHFLLVPGVGAQGGSLQEVSKYGMNSQIGLLVNSSRGIIFSENPKESARKLQQEMQQHIEEYHKK
ncbi:orotidine-5'-phosphate decarboxylase [Microscilla marina]|uniref:Orotidine-5'-phosphate decarboxylase n=1 Tax=Microscilla marina ATCC 23134 TaxID=313606 RepID=A1ZGI5_MICM2|nr:orotidine-5'-phosphate decarboxylase [Microscilla marina]EAY30602.1 orotidine 5'-phosphate decarboxylase [Microscilla marina ATCC 23134]